jgi:hypothetical protein
LGAGRSRPAAGPSIAGSVREEHDGKATIGPGARASQQDDAGRPDPVCSGCPWSNGRRRPPLG